LYLEEVSRIPVASGVACPLPHRHVGFSIADMVADIQRIKTAILREGLDNLYLSNNPQKVFDETKVNVEDVLISRPGGGIRTSDVNAISFIEHPFVFPQAMEGLEYMDQVRENRTGTNRYFTGIDQNSLNKTATGVQTLATMAAQRVEQIARILAFAIEDLFAIVHEQVLKQGHKRETIQLQGKWVEVDPGSWKKRNHFKICVAFSAGNKDAQMARLNAVWNQMVQAAELQLPIAKAENFYAIGMEMLKMSDLAVPERFLTDPKTLPPAPPPPPPPEIVKADMEIHSRERVKAAEIMQQEVESERKAALERYKIDSEYGIELIHKQIDHGHTVAIEGLKASHEAILQAMAAKLDQTHNAATSASTALGDAKGHIEKHGVDLQTVHATLNNVLNEVKRTHALATGRKVVRKNKKGEIEGIDIFGHDGTKLASHIALKDHTGRIVGMQ